MGGASKFNWCFIGAGKLANIVAKAILPAGRHGIAAVYTRSLQKCRDFADRYGGVACGSAEDAICAPDVDGVYIATPHNSHYQYARLALSLGKPVLCEKPITVTAREAEELFSLAQVLFFSCRQPGQAGAEGRERRGIQSGWRLSQRV